jgi:hypothetical protein
MTPRLIYARQSTNKQKSRMKRHIQSLLRRLGLLERLQSSSLYDLYWRVRTRKIITG